MAEHNEFGKLAEDLAADFLAKKGYKILVRNFRFQHHEIDIVSEFKDLIVVTEVKARSYDTLIEPQEAVNKKKIKSIVQTADFFMTDNQSSVPEFVEMFFNGFLTEYFNSFRISSAFTMGKLATVFRAGSDPTVELYARDFRVQ